MAAAAAVLVVVVAVVVTVAALGANLVSVEVVSRYSKVSEKERQTTTRTSHHPTRAPTFSGVGMAKTARTVDHKLRVTTLSRSIGIRESGYRGNTCLNECKNMRQKYTAEIQGRNTRQKFTAEIHGRNTRQKFTAEIHGRNHGRNTRQKYTAETHGRNTRQKYTAEIHGRKRQKYIYITTEVHGRNTWQIYMADTGRDAAPWSGAPSRRGTAWCGARC